MADLKGQPAEVRFTLTVTRKDTGKVETVEMVGHQIPNPEPEQEKADANDSQHGSA